MDSGRLALAPILAVANIYGGTSVSINIQDLANCISHISFKIIGLKNKLIYSYFELLFQVLISDILKGWWRWVIWSHRFRDLLLFY